MKDPEMIRCADYTIRGDKEVVMGVVKRNGMLLSYAEDELKDDYEIVRAAVANSGLALRYASDRLQNNDELIQMAKNYRRKMGWQR